MATELHELYATWLQSYMNYTQHGYRTTEATANTKLIKSALLYKLDQLAIKRSQINPN